MNGLLAADWASWAYYIALASTVGAVLVPLGHSIFLIPRSAMGALYGAAVSSVGALLAYTLSAAEPAGVTDSLGVQLPALATTLLFSMAFGINLPAVCEKMWRANGVRDGLRLIFPTALFATLALLIFVAQPLPGSVALQTYRDPVNEEIVRAFTAEAEVRERVASAIDRQNQRELCRVAEGLRDQAQQRPRQGQSDNSKVSRALARLDALEQAGVLPLRSGMPAGDSIDACHIGQGWEGVDPIQVGRALAGIAGVLDAPDLRPRMIGHPKGKEVKTSEGLAPDDAGGHRDGDIDRSPEQNDEAPLAISRPSLLLASWRAGRDLAGQAARADTALPEYGDGSMPLLVLSEASLIVLALAVAGMRTAVRLDGEG